HQVLIAERPQQDGVLLRVRDIQDKIRGEKDSGAWASAKIRGDRTGVPFAVGTVRATPAKAKAAYQDRAPTARMVGIDRKYPGIRDLRFEIHVIGVTVVHIGQPAELR